MARRDEHIRVAYNAKANSVVYASLATTRYSETYPAKAKQRKMRCQPCKSVGETANS
jgi:hypothetical protein